MDSWVFPFWAIANNFALNIYYLIYINFSVSKVYSKNEVSGLVVVV